MLVGKESHRCGVVAHLLFWVHLVDQLLAAVFLAPIFQAVNSDLSQLLAGLAFHPAIFVSIWIWCEADVVVDANHFPSGVWIRPNLQIVLSYFSIVVNIVPCRCGLHWETWRNGFFYFCLAWSLLRLYNSVHVLLALMDTKGSLSESSSCFRIVTGFGSSQYKRCLWFHSC